MIYLGNQAVGVSLASVGEFTKYEQVKVTPSVTEQLEVSHNLGVIPKLVVVKSSITYVSTTFLTDGVLDQQVGGMRNLYSADGYSVQVYTVSTNTMATSNSYAYFSNEKVRIRRATSAKYFDTNTEYTVDIYA